MSVIRGEPNQIYKCFSAANSHIAETNGMEFNRTLIKRPCKDQTKTRLSGTYGGQCLTYPPSRTTGTDNF